MVQAGYAILDNATIPIIGEGDQQPNDSYVEQLVAGAKAAIDEGVKLGVVDRNRVAVMGHSYGAFMTANLLAHTNIFRAGVAESRRVQPQPDALWLPERGAHLLAGA